MEDAIVDFVNSQNMEHRVKLIEYLKCWNSHDIDEHIEKRKKIGGKNFQSEKLFFSNFLMTVLPLDDILKKLQTTLQSHST
jgi:hypothetical protein